MVVRREKGSMRWRIKAVFLVMLLSLGVVVCRLVDLQILQHDTLERRSSRQHERTVVLQPDRGAIFDRDMRVLAMSVPVDSLYAVPSQIEDPRAAAVRLGRVLRLQPRELEGRLRCGKSFVWVKRKVSEAESRAVERLGLAGTGFLGESKRYYPWRSLLSQAMGFVGTDNKGLGGLEYYYDAVLAGKAEEVVLRRDALGRAVLPVRGAWQQHGGEDVVLTVDAPLQYLTERSLAAQVERTSASGGEVIVMDVRTGEILAMAEAPAFNPNSFSRYSQDRWRSSSTQAVYEPGSTIKLVAAAGVLEEGLAKPTDLYFCEQGSIRVGGKVIRDVHPYAWLTLSEVVQKSSNVGAIKMCQQLGGAAYERYLRLFGFGSQTGIDLAGEAAGIVRPVAEWSRVSLGALAIGQELAATPLQMLRAYAAVANDGLLVRPRIVRAIYRDGRCVKRFEPEVQGRAVSAETARALGEILHGCVERGTCREAGLEGYAVAGKTGTAQVIDPVTGAYSPDRYIASFVGFLPARDPRVAILVKIDHPQGAYYGGEVAAPLFREVAWHVVRRLRIPPADGDSRLFVARREQVGNVHVGVVSEEDERAGANVDGVARSLRIAWEKIKGFYEELEE